MSGRLTAEQELALEAMNAGARKRLAPGQHALLAKLAREIEAIDEGERDIRIGDVLQAVKAALAALREGAKPDFGPLRKTAAAYWLHHRDPIHPWQQRADLA